MFIKNSGGWYFENKKAELIKLCEEMDRVEKDYLRAKHELEIRKNLYL